MLGYHSEDVHLFAYLNVLLVTRKNPASVIFSANDAKKNRQPKANHEQHLRTDV